MLNQYSFMLRQFQYILFHYSWCVIGDMLKCAHVAKLFIISIQWEDVIITGGPTVLQDLEGTKICNSVAFTNDCGIFTEQHNCLCRSVTLRRTWDLKISGWNPSGDHIQHNILHIHCCCQFNSTNRKWISVGDKFAIMMHVAPLLGPIRQITF